MSGATDAVMLACAEALARWRRPSASAWGLLGPGALRLALGAPLSAPELDVAVPASVDLEEVVANLHVVAAARVSSRLGCHLDVSLLGGDHSGLRVSAVEAGVVIDLRFPVLAEGESLQSRSRWPMARVQSDKWPRWQVATLVATPKILLADTLQRAAAGFEGAAEDLRWLVGRGVATPDPDTLAGCGGRAVHISEDAALAEAVACGVVLVPAARGAYAPCVGGGG